MSENESTTTTTAPAKLPGILQRIGEAIMPKSANARIKKNKEAESYGDEKGGNPCHYQTHKKERQGMNRQGRKSGRSCHHGK